MRYYKTHSSSATRNHSFHVAVAMPFGTGTSSNSSSRVEDPLRLECEVPRPDLRVRLGGFAAISLILRFLVTASREVSDGEESSVAWLPYSLKVRTI